jgi:hypothetical protein
MSADLLAQIMIGALHDRSPRSSKHLPPCRSSSHLDRPQAGPLSRSGSSSFELLMGKTARASADAVHAPVKLVRVDLVLGQQLSSAPCSSRQPISSHPN